MWGARTVRRGEEGWPRALDLLSDPPRSLRVKGEIPGPGDRAVAVVGSREAGEEGLEQARKIGAAIARNGAWVISGGAAGIDAAAHAGALEGGGRTLVVLGGGLDHLYPAENRGLFARVVEAGGGLAAEAEDGQRAATWSFPRRNRIVAALGEATVVVRAGARSGALLTAERASAMGLPVWVAGGVPGEQGQGLERLLTGGAFEFGSIDALLTGLGLTSRSEDRPPVNPVGLGAEAASLWSALGAEPCGADDVARRAGVGPGAALAGLMELELLGLVERRPRGYARRDAMSRGG